MDQANNVSIEQDLDLNMQQPDNENTDGVKTSTPIFNKPYSLADIQIQIPEMDDDGEITCIEAWENNMYIGTSKGQIIHMYKMDEESGYITISKHWVHTSKRNSIERIILLSEISKVIILFGTQLTCYALPELSPANIGKVKDVTDLSIYFQDSTFDHKRNNHIIKKHKFEDQDEYCRLTAFTSTSIRMLRIFDDGITLHREILNNNSIVAGIQNGPIVAIGKGDNEYDIINIENSQLRPLFPISTSNGPLDFKPKMASLTNNELLLVCGGSNSNEPSMGMIVNFNGDVTRGTLTWDSYPRELIADYPHIITKIKTNSIIIHSSLNEQNQIDEIKLDFEFKIQMVSKLFKIKDKEMIEKITISPIVSQMSNKELERITVESDNANKESIIESSILLFDSKGTNFKLLKPISKIDRWLNEVNKCDNLKSQMIFDKLNDELKTLTTKRNSNIKFFLISLLGLFCLKFQLMNELFDIWITNYKILDPRLLIYIMGDGDIEIHQSVWTYQGLFKIVEKLKDTFSSEANNEIIDFYKLYLSSCLTLKFPNDNEEILKIIEITLINKCIDDESSLGEIINDIKYSKNETIELLLLNKKYWMLSKFYKKLGEHKQYLYYFKGLITREFNDDEFNEFYTKNKNSVLNDFCSYLLKHCLGDFDLIWKHIAWLLNDHCKFGLQILMDPSVKKMEFNEIKILDLISRDTKLQWNYLKYLYETKKERQFIGDLVISSLKNLELIINDGIKKEIEDFLTKYQRMKIPRMSLLNYWYEVGIENKEFALYHNELLKYLEVGLINNNTVIILNTNTRSSGNMNKKNSNGNNSNLLTNVEILLSKLKISLPLIQIPICKIQGEIKKVIDIYCETGDFLSAEEFANNLNEDSEIMLSHIFDVYLSLGLNELIDRFLTKYDLQGANNNPDIIERIDQFNTIIKKLPDHLTTHQIKRFLIQNLIQFNDAETSYTVNKCLLRSKLSNMKKISSKFENFDLGKK